ncbi:BES1/BZR1 [Hibiscus syriacus]|uniref:BES1/BZR1 n=1 Tax=Hibiscus syriacus TaxID=106335 RepID=A0A6A2X215_HIBSY|nr:BES1/BZR1 [Hibiscus syriacus]
MKGMNDHPRRHHVGTGVDQHPRLHRVLSEAWQETVTESNLGNVKEILEAEPPKWLADSVDFSCMLCGVRFYPIMCFRHQCRFCGGTFCGECSKGRSLMPGSFMLLIHNVSAMYAACDSSLSGHVVSNSAQLPAHDATDSTTLRSWVLGGSMEHETNVGRRTAEVDLRAGDGGYTYSCSKGSMPRPPAAA